MKFITLSTIIVGIIIFFNLGGITTPAGGFAASLIIDLDSDESPIQKFKDYPLITIGGVTYSIWNALVSVLAGVLIVGARAVVVGSAPQLQYYTAAFSIAVAGILLTDLGSIFLKLWDSGEGWIRAVLLLIFIPLSIMYLLSVKMFVEGTDY